MRLETTVELFAGIGGFRLAAEKRGIRTLWANDIDGKAAAVYKDQFGSDELRHGDLREFLTQVPEHDLLTAGFPCQPFSSAGKKEGIRDPRGNLFQTTADVIAERRPTAFILENVKRLLTMEQGDHFATILWTLANLGYAVEWRLLNAVDFGLPQNRRRVIIVGLRDLDHAEGPASHLAPRERIKALPESVLRDLPRHDCWREILDHGRSFPEWGLAASGRFVGGNFRPTDKAPCSSILRDILQEDVDDQFDFTESTRERLSQSVPVDRYVEGVQVLHNQEGGRRMGYTVFGVDGLAPTLTASTSRHYERYQIDGRFRRLTNVEYARLQGFPDDFCKAVSPYDQYFLYGNAVPPPLAGWVMDRLQNPVFVITGDLNHQRNLFPVHL